MSDYFSHPTALVESKSIGDDTKIWCFSHITEGAIIGKNCNIGPQARIRFKSNHGEEKSKEFGLRATKAREIKPAKVKRIDTISIGLLPYSKLTSFSVGTTTMRFGVALHGPSAPLAFQLGK